MDGGVSDGKLEILAYVWVEAHDIHILKSLIVPHFIVETHGLRPATVQGITGTHWTLSYYGMCEYFGFLVKFTFSLNHELLALSALNATWCVRIAAQVGDIPERLARVSVPKTAK